MAFPGPSGEPDLARGGGVALHRDRASWPSDSSYNQPDCIIRRCSRGVVRAMWQRRPRPQSKERHRDNDITGRRTLYAYGALRTALRGAPGGVLAPAGPLAAW